jgi:hypothetical protein
LHNQYRYSAVRLYVFSTLTIWFIAVRAAVAYVRFAG